MIQHPTSILPPCSNSRRCFKKSWNHCFCDTLEIVILNFDLCCLLKDIQDTPEVNHLLRTYLRNTPKFWKMAKNVFNQLVGALFWLKNLWLESCYVVQISNGKVGLETYPWKDFSTIRIFLICLSFFFSYQSWISHSINPMQLIKRNISLE